MLDFHKHSMNMQVPLVENLRESNEFGADSSNRADESKFKFDNDGTSRLHNMSPKVPTQSNHFFQAGSPRINNSPGTADREGKDEAVQPNG